MTEREIFQSAAKLPDDGRAAYLDRTCGGDAELRARVQDLLRGGDDASAVTLGPAPAVVGVTGDYRPDENTRGNTAADPNATDAHESGVRASRNRSVRGSEIGAVIAGRYTLVEVIGEGGMGSVYLARQSEPVKRQVALKLIKSGFDSRSVLARFDAERQALALMDHPNIARIYDGGVTDQTQPFFVMELVQGVPLTDYCDRKRLSVRQRLELFVSICQAIQHAHQKGIIHRDLKPGNVLVTEVDGKPAPKVIDFGVAKATEQKLTEMSLADAGAIVGTPAYMSPEQADPTSMDIDTRTDVYALGVMLYELLTGTPPLDARQFKRGALLEMLRMVREVEPPRPSARLSAAADLSDIAAKRSIEPGKLAKLLRGELDWVVMKALEKDRARRYETANGLARDLQRYLADEVVEARPPSRGYRLRKFVKRNKGQVIAAGLLAVTLVGGIVGTTVGLIRANRFADREQAANAQAQARLTQIEKGNAVLTAIFSDLDIRQVRADKDPLEAVLAKRLVKAAEELEGDALGDPLAVADLQGKLGISLLSLGYPREAVPLLDKALQTRTALLGEDHPDTLRSAHSLAFGHWENARYDVALALHTRTYERRKATLGADHADTRGSLFSLAATHHQQNNLEVARTMYEECLRHDPESYVAMGNLANIYSSEGKHDQAIELHLKSLKLRQAKMGPVHPDTFISRMALAGVYKAAGKATLAQPLQEETLKLARVRLGDEHPTTLLTLTTLVGTYDQLKQYDLALRMRQDILKGRKARLGEENPKTLQTMRDIAWTYDQLNQPDLALSMRQETLKLCQKALGADDRETLTVMGEVARGYQSVGKHDLALPLLEDVLRIRKVKFGLDHRETYNAMNDLSLGYRRLGKYDLALALADEAVQRARAKFGADHREVVDCLESLTQRYLDVAVLLAWFGKDADLAVTADRMIAFVRGTQSVVSLERTAKVWCLVKSAETPVRAEVLDMARRAVALGQDSKDRRFVPYFLMAQGMAEYRNDQFAQAAATMATLGGKEVPTKDPDVLGTAGLFRAMSLYRLGKLEEARAVATAAVKEMKPLPADEKNPLAGGRSIDDLIVWMAYKEAKALIAFPAEPNPEKKP